MIRYEDRPPAAAAGEWRRADGTWPVGRADMRDEDCLVARMALDWLAEYDRCGLVWEPAIARLGWPIAVMRRYTERVRIAFLRLRDVRDEAAGRIVAAVPAAA